MLRTIRSRTRAKRALLALALTLALGAATLMRHSERAAARTRNTPAGRVLVVTANLREAYGRRDLAHARDLAVFAARVSSLRWIPDVLLLQEVRRSSAVFVAKALTRATHQRFRVAVDAGRRAVVVKPRRIVLNETAIVVNTATMASAARGGLVPTSYPRRLGTEPRPMVKRQAYGLVKERAGGMLLPVASVHLTPAPELISMRASDRLRRRWAVQVAGKLRAAFGDLGGFATIGGDFNSGRCRRHVRPCRPAPFWAALTGDVRGFRDSVQIVKQLEGVDYVFTRGGVHAAGIDARRRVAYSDHRFRWAVVGPDRRSPTAPAGLDGVRAGERDVSLTWEAATDDGSGLARYEIWRAGPARDFRRIDVTRTTSYRDRTTYRTKRYLYFVRAVDRAHNIGPSSAVAKVSL